MSSPRLFVALDYNNLKDARRLVSLLSSTGLNVGYKIGLELAMRGGLDFAKSLKRKGHTVFLDMKFLDIGHTIEGAVVGVAEMGVDYLTIHAHTRKALRAAVKGRGNSNMKIWGVTVLTSHNRDDVEDEGWKRPLNKQVLRRAKMAMDEGLDGVVSSGHEANIISQKMVEWRRNMPFDIVTPGIRLLDDNVGDQSRVMTPANALRAGATHLVVGRPIIESQDPIAATRRFLDDMERAA